MDIFEKLLNRTYNFLSYRPRSEKEVRDYLVKKKAEQTDIQKIIIKLKEQKFLNDKEFTQWWIEQRSRVRPKALRVIKLELKQKGIANDLIEEVLNESVDLKTELEKAMELGKKKLERFKNLERQKVYEKLGRFLASKGFDWDTIKKVIDQLVE